MCKTLRSMQRSHILVLVTHLFVCWGCDWIAVSGRPQIHVVVVLFLYSELFVYVPRLHQTTSMCESMVIFYCGAVPINSMIDTDCMFNQSTVEFTSNVGRRPQVLLLYQWYTTVIMVVLDHYINDSSTIITEVTIMMSVNTITILEF